MMERRRRDEEGIALIKWLDRADKRTVLGAVSMDSLNEQAVLHLLMSCRLTPFAHYWRSGARTYLYNSLSQKKFCERLRSATSSISSQLSLKAAGSNMPYLEHVKPKLFRC